MVWGSAGISGISKRAAVRAGRRNLIGSGLVAAGLLVSGCFQEDKGKAPDVVTPVDSDLPRVFSTEGPGQAGLKQEYIEEKRVRIAPLRLGAFDDAAVLAGTKRFVFNFFEDLALAAEVERAEMPEAGRLTLNGQLAGVAGSWFIVSSTDGMLSATVFHPQAGYFEVEPAGDGLSKVTEFAPNRVPAQRHGMLFPHGSVHIHEPATPLRKTTAGPSVIDILVVYTADAAAGATGEATLKARIVKSVDDANAAFVNSKIDASLRLVHVAKVAYVESGNMGTDLGRLQKAGDGFLDDVAALRKTYGADLVSLVVEKAGGIAGIGYVMTQVQPWFKDWAFTVVGRAYIGSYHTLAHEVGHNLGCAHDRDNSKTQAAYPFSYGYRYMGTDGNQYRDIMAYYPGTPIPHFSNPNVVKFGAPTGIPDGQPNSADNARTINLTSPTAAAFLPSVALPGDPIPTTWTGADIGAPALAGSHATTANGFTVSGAGADIWGAADQFRFLSQSKSGDVEITARLVSVANTNAWAKAGVMIRENTTAGSRHAFTAATPGSGLAFQRRVTAGGASTHIGLAGAAPRWVRLKRTGNVFTSSVSTDGSTWTVVGSETIAMGAATQVGLAVTSHNTASLAAAAFESVTVR